MDLGNKSVRRDGPPKNQKPRGNEWRRGFPV